MIHYVSFVKMCLFIYACHLVPHTLHAIHKMFAMLWKGLHSFKLKILLLSLFLGFSDL